MPQVTNSQSGVSRRTIISSVSGFTFDSISEMVPILDFSQKSEPNDVGLAKMYAKWDLDSACIAERPKNIPRKLTGGQFWQIKQRMAWRYLPRLVGKIIEPSTRI
jgi:hypothetical protein